MSYLFKTYEAPPFAYIEGAFSKEQCESVIEIGTAIGTVDAEIVNSKTSSRSLDSSLRISKTCFIPYAANTDWLYKGLSSASSHLNNKFFNFDLTGFIEDIQFAQYFAPDGKFSRHSDCVLFNIVRKLSISVQLSDESSYEGGDLELDYGNPIKMPRKQGTLIAFPSWAVHEITPVTAGERCSLVAWISGPEFK